MKMEKNRLIRNALNELSDPGPRRIVPYVSGLERGRLMRRSSATPMVEAKMTHYEIRFEDPEGSRSVTWDVERADDAAALRSALEVCGNQTVGRWGGAHHKAPPPLSLWRAQ